MAIPSSGGAGVAPPGLPPKPKGITIGQGTNWYRLMQQAQNAGQAPQQQPNPAAQALASAAGQTPPQQQPNPAAQALASALGTGVKIGAPPKATPQQAQGAATPSPLDATALGNEATNQFNVGNKINALALQGSQNDVALQSALGQLAQQQPIDQLKQMYAANRQGGLYGSVEAGDQGLITRGYQEKGSALTTNAGNTNQRITNEIGALLGGIPLYNNSQATASALRLAKIAAANPAQAPPVGGGKGGKGSPGQPPAGGKGSPGQPPVEKGGKTTRGNGLVNYNNFIPKADRGPYETKVARGNGLVNYNRFIPKADRGPYGTKAPVVVRQAPKGKRGTSGGTGY